MGGTSRLLIVPPIIFDLIYLPWFITCIIPLCALTQGTLFTKINSVADNASLIRISVSVPASDSTILRACRASGVTKERCLVSEVKNRQDAHRA
ncbi:uncharacterized protein LOC133521005 isoform X2 [Cydia pomonella]|uniref:uncharacterized protein LOC133521005 isoform X2 n=1 Tax=Cydia pomonella TaxID=82600 RepID=UPI002ADD4F35|nr:uncharacterized protein LOC133521005 isoform X2 [Cydia pomonella]